MVTMEHIGILDKHTETADKHVCGLCGESFTSVFEFLKHKIIHVGRETKTVCEICQLPFSRQGPLIDHYRRKHQINIVQKAKDLTTKTTTCKLRTKKHVVEISQPCLKDNSRESGVTGDVLNNFRVTKFDVLPKGDMLIIRPLDNLQEHTSDIVAAMPYHDKSEQNIYENQTDSGGVLSSLSNEHMTSINTVSSATSQIYSVGKIPEKQYILNTVNAGSEIGRNNDFDNCAASEQGSIFSAHKLQWCEDTTTTMDFTPDPVSTDVDTVGYISDCVQDQRNSLKNADEKVASPSENDDHYMDNQPEDITNIPTSIPQTDVPVKEHELVHSFVTDSLVNEHVTSNNIHKEDQEMLDTASNLDNKKKTYSSRQVHRRKKFIPIDGRIPQELYMSDFYFLKITSQTGSSTAISSGRDLFQCLLCKKIKKWRSDICRHMREFHEDDLASGEALKLPTELNDDDGNLIKMTEYIELETVRKPGKRIRGVETQDLPGEFACDDCGKVFNKLRNLRFHKRVHETGNEILCSICSKLLKSKANFQAHLKTHEKREAYKCNQCDFESTVNIAIHKHRQIHNTTSYLCDICGRAYKDKSTLTKHKKVHDLSRPFSCTHPGCSWRFLTEVMCNAHIRSHTTKRKFKCRTCGYVFNQKHHLQRHEKIIHNIVHKTKPGMHSYNWSMDGNNESDLQSDSKDGNNLEVSHEVNLIINEETMPGVMSAEHFDLESALQSGQLVIANDDGTSINYEMSDIGSNVVYQTLLHDGVGQQFGAHTICIADSVDVSYHEVNSVQSEVEIEQS